MTPAVVWDCSVAAAMVFENERDDYVRRVWDVVCRSGALVPAHWPMELVNVLRVSERRKRILPSDSGRYLMMMDMLSIQVEGTSAATESMMELYQSSVERSLTSYDAAYLLLAQKSGLPLASKDDDLKEAALKAGVKLFS